MSFQAELKKEANRRHVFICLPTVFHVLLHRFYIAFICLKDSVNSILFCGQNYVRPFGLSGFGTSCHEFSMFNSTFYKWETVGNSLNRSCKAFKPSVDIKFYDVLSTMLLWKWYGHVTVTLLWWDHLNEVRHRAEQRKTWIAMNKSDRHCSGNEMLIISNFCLEFSEQKAIPPWRVTMDRYIDGIDQVSSLCCFVFVRK